MTLFDFAARHRRVVLLVTVLLTAAGVYAMATLPSSVYPEVEFPRIQIVAKAGDLSPRLAQLALTRPLEEAARTVPGARRVRSKTIRGAAEISVLFQPETDMRHALQIMQGRIDAIRAGLPEGAEVVVERMTPSLFPILSLNLTGSLPPVDLRDLAVYTLRPLLSRVAGVAGVEVLASQEREIAVIVDPDRLNASKVTLTEVADALADTNRVVSVGRLPREGRQYLLLATAEIVDLDDLRRVVVAFHEDTPIAVGDLAEVREGVADPVMLVSGNGAPAALISVTPQVHGSVLEIADGVWKALAAYRPSLPPGVHLQITYDLAAFVRDAVANVRDAILVGGCLAILVLLVFLRDGRVTALAALSLPLTLAPTFFLLKLLGGTINLMSLGGLAIAIGLVIDDAVVVVENIQRHRAAGEPVAVAASRATSELFAAVVGSTLTTVVVFAPLLLLRGVVGQFFAALSLTLTAALVISLLYAVLFIPMAAARFIPDAGRPPLEAGRLAAFYRKALAASMRRPGRVVLGVLAILAAGVALFLGLGTGFMPEVDEGGYVIDYWTPEGTSLAETDAMLKRLEEAIAATPEVAAFARRTGAELGLFATEQNRGDIVVKLKPRSARRRSAEEVIADQRAAFASRVPGMTIEFVELLQDMLGDLEGNPEPIEVKIFGDDLPTLARLADRTAERLKAIPGIVDLVVPQRSNPTIDLKVDPTRAARVGLTPETVAAQLSTGLLGRVATALRHGDRVVNVRVRFPDRNRFDLDWIRTYPLDLPGGGVLPLSSVADLAMAPGEAQLFREDLQQMVPVSARLEGRDLGGGVRDVERALRLDSWPVGTSYVVGGLRESYEASFRSMLLVLGIAAALVLGVLVAQFRRFTPALMVISVAPIALAGAFALLRLTGTPLNVSSFMGIILLVGLVVKNGIILIDYAQRLEAAGRPPAAALEEAAVTRLRPILMTTLCTLFGLLPLAFGLGPGAEMQKPLAIAVIGGLSVSTAATLLFLPACLAAVQRMQQEA